MKDIFGRHVQAVDDDGFAGDHDSVTMRTSVRGSFTVAYSERTDLVCVEVDSRLGNGRLSMELTVEQAVLLRDLVDAGLSDALAAPLSRCGVTGGRRLGWRGRLRRARRARFFALPEHAESVLADVQGYLRLARANIQDAGFTSGLEQINLAVFDLAAVRLAARDTSGEALR